MYFAHKSATRGGFVRDSLVKWSPLWAGARITGRIPSHMDREDLGGNGHALVNNSA